MKSSYSYNYVADRIAVVFFLILLFVPNMAQGQEEYSDSLTQRFHLLDSLAKYHHIQGNDSMAIVYANNSLTIVEALYGKDHMDYAHVLKNIAKYRFETGEYEEAKKTILEAIEIQKENYSNTKDYAESLSTLSDIMAIEGDFSNAIEICSKSLSVITEIYGPNTIEVAIAKGNLADVYYASSSFSKALQLCNEAISIFLLHGISNDSDYATIVSIRSKAKTDLGLYVDALADAKESLDVFVNLYGEQYYSNAVLLSNLSLIYSYLGNYTEAYKYGEKALRLYAQTYGEQHPYYVVTLQNIASYKYENGELVECIQLAERANRICNQNNGNDFPVYIFVPLKVELSRYYVEANNYENALITINEVIGFLQQSDNMNTDEYASALLVLAEIYSKKGIHNKAIKCAKKSTQIMLSIYGQNNIRYSQFTDELSHYYSNDYHYKEAVNYAMHSMKIRKEYIVSNYSDMSSLQRNNLWSRFGPAFFYYAGLAFRCRSSLSLLSDVYDNTCLFAKGLLLSTEISMRQLIAESRDSVLINDYNKLLLLKEHYNRLCERPLIDNKETVDSLIFEIQSRELDITRRSKSYGDYMTSMNLSWKYIQQQLGTNDIAIEFIDFPVKNDSIIYVALTTRKDSDFPKMIPLFEEKQLLGVSDTIYYLCKDMYNLVWRPLQSELQDVNNIYFSPSGALHRIGIEYLPGMEKYNIYRLSSTRELVTKKKKQSGDSAVLFGGLDYYTKIDTIGNDKSQSLLYNKYVEHANVRGMKLRGGKEYLPHTKEEVEQIAAELHKAQWTCQLDTLDKGTEESFKSLSGKRINTIHISTHGFYYTPDEADRMGYDFLWQNNKSASTEDKALTRTGLIMSGANHILEGEKLPKNVEDGILTAKEIADLDLRGLDLVVLSACQTGLGDISQGEGVFGLQRGFKKAGANSILMSLWEVNDEATQILMTQFYKNLVSGQSKRQSLRSAQKYLRDYNNGRFNEPKYWAAFILLDGIN